MFRLTGRCSWGSSSTICDPPWITSFSRSATATERSQFPIYTVRTEFQGNLGKIQGITNQLARQIIEEEQPFNVGEPSEPESCALWVLNKLSNIDKHRRVHLCRRQVTRAEVRGLPAFRELLSYVPVVFNNEMEVEVDLALYISLDEPEAPVVTNFPLDELCESLLTDVSDIVGRLEATIV